MTRRHNCRLLDRKKGINWPFLLVLLVGAFLQSCASPGGKLERLAKDKGLYQKNVRAAGYDLTSFANRPFSVQPAPDTENKILRIYLEGDGSPWKHRTIIMSDPTPRNPLMLRLMALDSLPAAYLGRPCYNGTAQDQGCDNSLWTSARYSDTVIESMASGIRALAKRFEATELWLFGHSGGGALALLLAERLPSVSRLITIAGNLDTEAWIRHHGYTPLFSSLNPASQPLLRDSVWQWHLLGAKDAIIPPQLVQPFIVRQPQATAFVLKNFNHGCCWESIWPEVLDALQNDDPARISGTQFKSRAN